MASMKTRGQIREKGVAGHYFCCWLAPRYNEKQQPNQRILAKLEPPVPAREPLPPPKPQGERRGAVEKAATVN
jgi:hypothetical protein